MKDYYEGLITGAIIVNVVWWIVVYLRWKVYFIQSSKYKNNNRRYINEYTRAWKKNSR